MSRQLTKKRLLELEQQAAELQKRKRNTGDSIKLEEFAECYRWMLDNKCLSGTPDTYLSAITECQATAPNKFAQQTGEFFAKFNSKY